MAGGYSVSITARDDASAAIARINTSLARLGFQAERTASAARDFSDRGRLSANLDRISAGFANAGRGVGSFADGLLRAVPGMTALTGAASLAGLVRLTTAFAQANRNLSSMADRLGMSASVLANWQGAARLANVSAEALSGGLRTFRDTLNDAVTGRNDQAVAVLDILRVRFRDGALQARNFEEVLPEVADAIGRIRDVSTRAMVVRELFGTEELFGFLSRGAAGISTLRAEAARLNPVTDRQVEIGSELQDSLNRLQEATSGTANTLAERLAPALRTVTDTTTEWQTATGGLRDVLDQLPRSIEAWQVAAATAGGVLLAQAIPPLVRYTGLLAAAGLVRLPAAALTALGLPAALALALGYEGVRRAGEGYRESGAGTPEAQEERRRRWAERGRLGGFPDGPGGQEEERLRAQLSRLFMQRVTPWAPPAPGRPSSGGGSSGGPRGIRNNNPLNLSFVPGQSGLDPSNPSDGRFGRYTSMEAGIASAVRQMQIHAGRGDDTLARLITRWAPPSENNTAGYISAVSRATGLGPNDRLNLNDPAAVQQLVEAMAFMENGRRLDPEVARRGVAMGLGPPLAPLGPRAQVPPGMGGRGNVIGVVENRITVHAPPGTTVETRTEGSVQAPPARIETNGLRGMRP